MLKMMKPPAQQMLSWNWSVEDLCYEVLAFDSPTNACLSPRTSSAALELGELISQARNSSALSPEDLALRIKVSTTTLEALEAGTRWPSIQVLQDIAQVTARPLTWFFTNWWPELGSKLVAADPTQTEESEDYPARDSVDDAIFTAGAGG